MVTWGRRYYTGRKYACWGITQLRYALGWDKNAGRSFVVGFGQDPPSRIPDPAATCPASVTPCNAPKVWQPAACSHQGPCAKTIIGIMTTSCLVPPFACLCSAMLVCMSS